MNHVFTILFFCIFCWVCWLDIYGKRIVTNSTLLWCMISMRYHQDFSWLIDDWIFDSVSLVPICRCCLKPSNLPFHVEIFETVAMCFDCLALCCIPFEFVFPNWKISFQKYQNWVFLNTIEHSTYVRKERERLNLFWLYTRQKGRN